MRRGKRKKVESGLVRFPLTPALSRGGRESREQRCSIRPLASALPQDAHERRGSLARSLVVQPPHPCPLPGGREVRGSLGITIVTVVTWPRRPTVSTPHRPGASRHPAS